jgi:F0F1-type ATP synthase membrane subunit b/b'
MTRESVFEGSLLVGTIAFGLIFVLVLLTLVVVVSARREGRRISKLLEERYSRVVDELQRAQQAHSEAQRRAWQLEEQLLEHHPENLLGKLQQATQELEQLQRRLLESERMTGRLEQELLQQSERQEQQGERLEQERKRLMEEVERWHERYVASQQQVKRLEQERADARQKVEQLTQLREKLLGELREVE